MVCSARPTSQRALGMLLSPQQSAVELTQPRPKMVGPRKKMTAMTMMMIPQKKLMVNKNLTSQQARMVVAQMTPTATQSFAELPARTAGQCSQPPTQTLKMSPMLENTCLDISNRSIFIVLCFL